MHSISIYKVNSSILDSVSFISINLQISSNGYYPLHASFRMGYMFTCRMNKKKKNLLLFLGKTTTYYLSLHTFASKEFLIIFVMTRDIVKKISKYVLTAVIITSAFEELSDVGWIMYVVGIAGALIILGLSILIIHMLNENK